MLRKLRLRQFKTQADVAESMGVSQPNYQRWESGSAPVPEGQQKKLAKVLHCTVEEIIGEPIPFDPIGIKAFNISDDHTLFGLIVISFGVRGTLTLPVSVADYDRLFEDLQKKVPFVRTKTFDNRTIFIRPDAVSDVQFIREESDRFVTYQEENKCEDFLGEYPDEKFWTLMEYMHEPFMLPECEDIPEEEFDHVVDHLLGRDEEKDQEEETPDTPAPERAERIKQENDDNALEKFYQRATAVTWQLSSGQQRSQGDVEADDLVEIVSYLELDMAGEDFHYDLLPFKADEDSLSFFIRKAHLDYIWLPTRLLDEGECNYNEGVLEEAEADEERAREKADANAAKAAKAKVTKAANAETEAKATKAAKAKATRAAKAKLV